MIEIRELAAAEARRRIGELAAVLVDCVEGGASVSFMAGITPTEAEAFYAGVVDGVERGARVLLAAFADGALVGTVQVVWSRAPNQPHRGDVAKLLVRRSARGMGVARRLMEAAEDAARRLGRRLLVLDTATGGAAERLYESMGWQRVGVIPRYALNPDGSPCDTTVFWKEV